MHKDSFFFNLFKTDDPTTLAGLILYGLLDSCKAKEGCFYVLDIYDNSFNALHYSNSDLFPKKLFFSDIEKFINISNFNESQYSQKEQELLIPILKYSKVNDKGFCIGILHLKGVDILTSELKMYLEERSALFIKIISDLFIGNLFYIINLTVSFKKPIDEYFEELLFLLSEASRFPLIAIRKFDIETGALEIINYFGYDKSGPPSFLKDEIPQVFSKVIQEKKSIQIPFIYPFTIFEELKGLGIENIIVLPIIVEEKAWGILTLASKCQYYLNSLEISALEAVSHGLGTSIKNYINYNNAQAKLFDLANSATIISGLEIAQAVRHEAKNQLEELSDNMYFLYRNEGDKTKKNAISRLSDKIKELSNTIEKIKTATKPPVKEASVVNIKNVWEEAYDTLRGRLEDQNIRLKVNSNLNIQIVAYKDWLRHAFLNLLLNSLDAFKERGKKTGKEISVVLDLTSEQSDKIRFLYSDNAGGINPTSLSVPDSVKDDIRDDLNKLIFEKNVTSKGDAGSGFGLYLTRATIQNDHGGTIKLINYRNGVTFSIELSKKITKNE